jgi:hypothetical protein
MDDVLVPTYYLINRADSTEDLMSLLYITPPYCTIITSAADLEFAQQLGFEVLQTNNLSDARKIAEHINKETNRCPLVVSDKYEAVYAETQI